jgi:hypothetical protein
LPDPAAQGAERAGDRADGAPSSRRTLIRRREFAQHRHEHGEGAMKKGRLRPQQRHRKSRCERPHLEQALADRWQSRRVARRARGRRERGSSPRPTPRAPRTPASRARGVADSAEAAEREPSAIAETTSVMPVTARIRSRRPGASIASRAGLAAWMVPSRAHKERLEADPIRPPSAASTLAAAAPSGARQQARAPRGR